MNLYILDTDTCSYIIKRRPEAVLSSMRVAVEQGHHVTISAITYSELLLGAERADNKNKGKHHNLISEFVARLDEVLAWDSKAAEAFAKLQAWLYEAGSPIGPNDTMIAAHVLSRNGIIITNNIRHFSKVPHLRVNNWVDGNHFS